MNVNIHPSINGRRIRVLQERRASMCAALDDELAHAMECVGAMERGLGELSEHVDDPTLDGLRREAQIASYLLGRVSFDDDDTTAIAEQIGKFIAAVCEYMSTLDHRYRVR